MVIKKERKVAIPVLIRFIAKACAVIERKLGEDNEVKGHPPRPLRLSLRTSIGMVTIALLLGACSRAVPPSPTPSPKLPAPLPTVARVSARLIPHPVAGREECHLCHGEGEPHAMPADHAGRGDETCTVCHDVQPSPSRPAGGSAAEMGQDIWQERPGLSCRNCHGYEGEGRFGPPLTSTSLDFDTFRQRVRSPRSERMPPIATAPDDPAMEKSGFWISDDDLRLIHAWLAGVELAPTPEVAAPPITHGLEGREDCLFCHGADKAMPVPADHQGWSNDTCLSCHATE